MVRPYSLEVAQTTATTKGVNEMVIEDLAFNVELEPGWTANADPLDADAIRAMRRLLIEGVPGPLAVQISPIDDQDVSGHAASGATIDVMLTVGDDVEGHAFSLHFPSPDDAQRMRTRLAAGGLLIAALTVGSVAVATQVPMSHTVAVPVVQAAPLAPAAPFVNRGQSADIRSGDIVSEEAVPARPFVNRGLNADLRSGDIVSEEAVPPAAPAIKPVVHGEKKD